MLEFRRKRFSFILSTAAMVAPGMIQSSKHNKQQQEQQEQIQRQNAKLQKQQTEAMNKIAQQAQNDPSKLQAAQGVMQQKSYAVAPGLLKRGGQVVYEFAHGIGPAKMGKVLGSGLAMGTTMALGSYAVDKAIQADRKKITGGAPLPQAPKKPEEELRKEKRKKLIKLGAGAALTAGSVLAARKGYLGKGFENLSRGKNMAGTKINFLEHGATVGKHLKQGFTPGSILSGVGFAGLFGLPYLAERKQLIAQQKAAEQGRQKTYSDEPAVQGEEQQPQQSKAKRALKKAALGTAAVAGTFAAARRGALGSKIAKGANDMFMTYGKKIAGKNGNAIGNWMMKSGASKYGKAAARLERRRANKLMNSADFKAAKSHLYDRTWLKNASREEIEAARRITREGYEAGNVLGRIKADPRAWAKQAGQKRLGMIQSGEASNTIGESILNLPASFMGVGKKTTGEFLGKMRTNPGYSEDTRKVADWLHRHKKTALVGATGVGLIGWAPFGWGDKITRKAVGAFDKNAFAYEKSKEQQVPEEQ